MDSRTHIQQDQRSRSCHGHSLCGGPPAYRSMETLSHVLGPLSSSSSSFAKSTLLYVPGEGWQQAAKVAPTLHTLWKSSPPSVAVATAMVDGRGQAAEQQAEQQAAAPAPELAALEEVMRLQTVLEQQQAALLAERAALAAATAKLQAVEGKYSSLQAMLSGGVVRVSRSDVETWQPAALYSGASSGHGDSVDTNMSSGGGSGVELGSGGFGVVKGYHSPHLGPVAVKEWQHTAAGKVQQCIRSSISVVLTVRSKHV
jgi:hypothetical protein